MGVLGTIGFRREIFRHGGSEALRLEILAPDAPPSDGDRQNGADAEANIPQNGARNRKKPRAKKSSPKGGAASPGESAAARHLAALVRTLEHFVREQVLPEAEQALDAAVAAGCGYRFARYLCRISCEEEKRRGKAVLTVRFLVTSGGETRHKAELKSVWLADGSLQCRTPGHAKQSRTSRQKHQPKHVSRSGGNLIFKTKIKSFEPKDENNL